MRILFIAMADASHTARWISQLTDTDWEIRLFDAIDRVPQPSLQEISPWVGWNRNQQWIFPNRRGLGLVKRYAPFFAKSFDAGWQIAKVIREFKPHVLHSLEMQNESYPIIKSLQYLKGDFTCPWIYSSWGNDIYHFAQLSEHVSSIRQVLSSCHYLFADTTRDIELAYQNGFQGRFLGVFPGGGGYHLSELYQYRSDKPTSSRRTIAIKGYHHWAGRALNVFDALERHTELLYGYSLLVYSAHDAVAKRAQQFAKDNNLPLEIISRYAQLPHEQMVKKLSEARIHIGASISDGIPNTMLEAMIMRAFPIQSNPGGATTDWIDHGINGLLIDPEDIDMMAEMIHRALTDNELVNSAAIINEERVKRIGFGVVQSSVVQAYQSVYDEWYS